MSAPIRKDSLAPRGFEPEVLKKLNALLRRRSEQARRPSVARQHSSGGKADNQTAAVTQRRIDGGVSTLESHKKLDLDEFRLPGKGKGSETPSLPKSVPQLPQGDYFENGEAIAVPTTHGSSMPKVIAHYIYPERQSAIAQAPQSPARCAVPPAVAPRTLYETLAAACMQLKSFFIDDDPCVIEFSAAQIESSLEIRVEVQAVEFSGPRKPQGSGSAPEFLLLSEQSGKTIGVLAFLHIEDGNSLGPVRKIPIMAKPKRVRQLLNDRGYCTLPEDTYGEDIKAALKGLQAKLEARA